MTLQVSAKDLAMIEGFEISDAATYDRLYQNPTWPGGASGVTILIGLDCGYTTASQLGADLRGLASADDIEALSKVCGIKGTPAQAALASVKHVSLPYTVAKAVFENVDIPRTVALTGSTFANCAALSQDSFGMLVSLVFNRGADCSNTPSRKEMYQIHASMASSDFAAVPGLIRSMERLWRGVPGLGGLITRREAEAETFQSGLGLPDQAPAPLTAGIPYDTYLVLGSEGPLVSLAQAALKSAGCYGWTIDGVFGGYTLQAVEAFQAKKSLHVDGTAGPKTLSALGLES